MTHTNSSSTGNASASHHWNTAFYVISLTAMVARSHAKNCSGESGEANTPAGATKSTPWLRAFAANSAIRRNLSKRFGVLAIALTANVTPRGSRGHQDHVHVTASGRASGQPWTCIALPGEQGSARSVAGYPGAACTASDFAPLNCHYTAKNQLPAARCQGTARRRSLVRYRRLNPRTFARPARPDFNPSRNTWCSRRSVRVCRCRAWPRWRPSAPARWPGTGHRRRC